MNLIPVIDLMQGQVVRAVRGDRQAYRPIVSALCASSDPVTVARVLCTHCATRRLYVADLDALQGGAVQIEAIEGLLASDPARELWLDAGFRNAASAARLVASLGEAGCRVRPVFGSESLASRAELERCFARPIAGAASGGALLSLDRRDGQVLDVAGCWDSPELWPSRVIVMTLERVGSGAGPDLETVRSVLGRAPGAFVIGAGGIRDVADLARASAAGAGAWLVASALHDGRVGPVGV